jgi:DNA replication protein DnaC
MSAPINVDIARLPVMLTELRLPTIARLWPAIAETADAESWPAARILGALCEHELAEREQRRIMRHAIEARLPNGKTFDSFDFNAVPMVSKARLLALAQGDAWLEKGTNILLFGPPGSGKTHLASALGYALIDNGLRVLFARTTELVQRLQVARQNLALEAAIAKLDKYHLLILDDFAYVQKNQAESSVLFELISARYERRALMITANQPFEAWESIFPDKAMTIAAIDRLVHHAIIIEMNVESYRRRSATERGKAEGRARSTKTPSEVIDANRG